MVPIRLVLAVRDEQYIEPFLHYVLCSDFQRRLVVTAFSRQDAFLRYMEESGDLVHIVLAEPYFIGDKSSQDARQIPWICLGEEGVEKHFIGKLPKYQPLHSLLSAVLDLYRGGGQARIPTEGNCSVIGVYSALGGSGKTTVALNMAKQLAMQGKRMFYLNLETVNAGLLFQGETRAGSQRAGLARLLYDLKGDEQRQQTVMPSVSTYALKHSILQSDTFGPVDNLNEILEMEEQDTIKLMDYIADSGLYDAVIVDTDSSPNSRSRAVMERSDKLVWLLTDDWSGMQKTELWLAHLERSNSTLFNSIMGKTFFAVNRYSGEMSAGLPRKGMTLEATLSHISSWNPGIQQGALLHSPLFQRDVLRLCRDVFNNKEFVGQGGLAGDR
ncbi:cellulose biosynthesis protein BcsQ [Paenibacillus anaericanus]|uniref:AAA family ATPase n=1 Tax=Paenibacillus anaericanus TaxID=170367 RepID=UPI002781BCCB|nr:AAA family ATPase [Paenibacillus anaericanus]MDQ0087299.1 cellulose biosynthesis protein BcsQ [Paenibacillus anaericanus]